MGAMTPAEGTIDEKAVAAEAANWERLSAAISAIVRAT